MSEASNGIAEWFGHRIFPEVEHDEDALADQKAERCPFLTEATGNDSTCIKLENSKGVCTISSTSNGPRQDWLVCPFRALSDTMLREVVQQLFGSDGAGVRLVVAATLLTQESVRQAIMESTQMGGRPVVYFQNKLGGEISIPGTDRSPEFSLDITLAEISTNNKLFQVQRYGIWEVQTTDFHGSYKHAVKNLQAALRLHGNNFHEQVERNPNWPSDRIEGPNKSNVFKRTFYQMAFKFEIASQANCAGCVLSVPEAVWDSWQPHLGKPELVHREENVYTLPRDEGHELDPDAPACIHIFGPDETSDETPQPLIISKKVFTNTEAFAYHALKVAPEAAVGIEGTVSIIPHRILDRIKRYWPEFGDLGI